MLLPRLHPLSLPLFRRLRLRLRPRLRLQLQLPHHKPRALGLRQVMGVLVVVVVEAEAENQGVDVVGSVVGEAGEGVGITEGEVGEDVESDINICLQPPNCLVRQLFGSHSNLCQPVRSYTLSNSCIYTCTYTRTGRT